MQNQPVLNAAVVGSIVVAAISLLISFGVPISEDQKIALIGFIAVLTPVVLAFIQRRKVTPVGSPHDHSLRAGR